MDALESQKFSFLDNIPKKYLLGFLILVCLIGIAFMVGTLYLIDSGRIANKLANDIYHKTGLQFKFIQPEVIFYPKITLKTTSATLQTPNLELIQFIELENFELNSDFTNIIFSGENIINSIKIKKAIITTKTNHIITINDFDWRATDNKASFQAYSDIGNQKIYFAGKKIDDNLEFDILDNERKPVGKFTKKNNLLSCNFNFQNFADLLALFGEKKQHLFVPVSVKSEILLRPSDWEIKISELNFGNHQFNGVFAYNPKLLSGTLQSPLWDNDELPIQNMAITKNPLSNILLSISKDISLSLDIKDILILGNKYRKAILNLDFNDQDFHANLKNLNDNNKGNIHGKYDISGEQNIGVLEINAENFQINELKGKIPNLNLESATMNGNMVLNIPLNEPLNFNGNGDLSLESGKISSQSSPIFVQNALNFAINPRTDLNFCLKSKFTFANGVISSDKIAFASKQATGLASGQMPFTDTGFFDMAVIGESFDKQLMAKITESMENPIIKIDKVNPKYPLYNYIKANKNIQGLPACQELYKQEIATNPN